MIRFNNDYCYGAYPEILEALGKYNETSYSGYGTDDWCEKAKELIRRDIGMSDAEIHFFPGATQANFIVTAAALNSVQSVICPDSGHINAHEAASIENAGYKILALPNTDGKITAEQIKTCAQEYYDFDEAEFLTEPKMVYISFPTEWGTTYTLDELTAISSVCKEYDMYLFVDGARMAYGLGAIDNDITLKDFAGLADIFYLGGTKCGALFGEAVVLTNPALKRRFKAYMKQNGAVLAKGWLLGLQFYTMLETGLYYDRCRKANEQAMRIKEAFLAKGITQPVVNSTNQQFFLLSQEQCDYLGSKYAYEIIGWEDGKTIVRFCTSWATLDADVDALIADVHNMME